MALKYTVKTETVYDGDEEVGTVHGLSLNAIVGLVNLNRPLMEALFNKFNVSSDMSDKEIGAIGAELIESAPLLVAQIIALASDAYEGREEGANVLDEIRSMPFGLQLAFLEKIGPLTFSAGGGAKKILALVAKAVQGGSQSAN